MWCLNLISHLSLNIAHTPGGPSQCQSWAFVWPALRCCYFDVYSGRGTLETGLTNSRRLIYNAEKMSLSRFMLLLVVGSECVRVGVCLLFCDVACSLCNSCALFLFSLTTCWCCGWVWVSVLSSSFTFAYICGSEWRAARIRAAAHSHECY